MMDHRDTAHRRHVTELIVIDDDDTEHALPTKWVVCPTCNGRGSYVNPAIDSHGLTPEDFDQDPDFADDYMSGVYDVTCEECQGRTTVLGLDRDRADPALVELYDAAQEEEAAYYRMADAERAMGA